MKYLLFVIFVIPILFSTKGQIPASVVYRAPVEVPQPNVIIEIGKPDSLVFNVRVVSDSLQISFLKIEATLKSAEELDQFIKDYSVQKVSQKTFVVFSRKVPFEKGKEILDVLRENGIDEINFVSIE